MSKSLSRASNLALLLALCLAFSTTRTPMALPSLLDQFDDGNIATNTGLSGVGRGFTTSYVDCGTSTGASASESNGNATVSGASCVHGIQSNDAIDPTQTTMIWSRSSPARRRLAKCTLATAPVR